MIGRIFKKSYRKIYRWVLIGAIVGFAGYIMLYWYKYSDLTQMQLIRAAWKEYFMLAWFVFLLHLHNRTEQR